MKTPIQEVYENFNLMSDADFKAWMLNTDLLEKEKEERRKIFSIAYRMIPTEFDKEHCDEQFELFNKTFKTKER